MAIHFTILAWEIPWTEEPGGLPQSTGSQKVKTLNKGSSSLSYSFKEEVYLLIRKREDNHHYKSFHKYSPGTQTDQISYLQGLPGSLNQSKKTKHNCLTLTNTQDEIT